MAAEKFKFASGDLQGVLMSPNNLAVEWLGHGRIIFSFAQRGKAISAHFSSNKKGLRYLKCAINDFCEWIFEICEWCRMILAIVKNEFPGVGRLIRKCSFCYVINTQGSTVYMRAR